MEKWKACRSHEDFNGPLWDIPPEEKEEYDRRPFVRIEAADRTITAAHDLFEFRPEDVRKIEAVPEMLESLRDAVLFMQFLGKNERRLTDSEQRWLDNAVTLLRKVEGGGE